MSHWLIVMICHCRQCGLGLMCHFGQILKTAGSYSGGVWCELTKEFEVSSHRFPGQKKLNSLRIQRRRVCFLSFLWPGLCEQNRQKLAIFSCFWVCIRLVTFFCDHVKYLLAHSYFFWLNKKYQKTISLRRKISQLNSSSWRKIKRQIVYKTNKSNIIRKNFSPAHVYQLNVTIHNLLIFTKSMPTLSEASLSPFV